MTIGANPHHLKSHEASNIPEEVYGRGIRDCNGVVQVSLATDGVAPLARHTPAAQGASQKSGNGKASQVQETETSPLDIVRAVGF